MDIVIAVQHAEGLEAGGAVARIVGGIGVPHSPHFPDIVASGTPFGRETGQLYGQAARHLADMAPDLVIMVSSDHYNTFFESSLPIFSIVTAESASGPIDYPNLTHYDVGMAPGIARAVQTSMVHKGFDLGQTQELRLDHPVTIPLHFLMPTLPVPVLPIYVAGLMPPLPTSNRCFEFGEQLAASLAELEGDARVAVVASGSFSLEIGGTRMSDTQHTGVPDPHWAERVVARMKADEINELVHEASVEQIAHAGNAGGELLDWVTMLGAVQPDEPPVFVEPQYDYGHAFGVWRKG
jgi:aromatic ring-opening dioxygenase catalytic subunit (LigB family)